MAVGIFSAIIFLSCRENFLSEGTIRNALSSALSKLNLRDRTQLAIWSVQTGLASDFHV